MEANISPTREGEKSHHYYHHHSDLACQDWGRGRGRDPCHATCERCHLSLSEGKSTARHSSVVVTPRTHGVCYIHIIVYALTEALGFLLNCIPDEKQNMHCIVGRLHPTFGCAFCKYLCLSGRLEEWSFGRAAFTARENTKPLQRPTARHKVQICLSRTQARKG